MHFKCHALQRLVLCACLGVCLAGFLPRARAVVPTVLYSGQVDSFSFYYDGTITWGISVMVTWDGATATLDASVDTLNDYFVTNLDTTFQYDLTLAFCGAEGHLAGSAYDTVGFDINTVRVYDFACGSVPVECPAGCGEFTLTLTYTFSSDKFSHPGTFTTSAPIPLSADAGILIGIIAGLAVALGIAYRVHQKHLARAPPKRPYISQPLAYIIDPESRLAPAAPARFQWEPAMPVPSPPASLNPAGIGTWVSQVRMRAFIAGRAVPSWDALAEQLQSRAGVSVTPGNLRTIYVEWARANDIRYEE